jgi:hypothetical protein
MEQQLNPIHKFIEERIVIGSPPTVAELRGRRTQSEQKIKTFKISFWVAVAIINLMIWVPFPFKIPTLVMIIVGILCVGFAFSAPIIVIRKHAQCLESLKIVSQGPKRRSANVAGQKYIDLVKAEGRSFIQAEVDILAGSKYSAAE